jgi:hypothetical protein
VVTPDGEKAMAQITYYGHNNTREVGADRPHKGEGPWNIKIDATVTSGPHTGTASEFKAKKVPADIAWLLQEGMKVPVFTDGAGKITNLDIEGLQPLLEHEKEALDAAHKKQSSFGYDFVVPDREDREGLKDLGRDVGKGIKGLFKRKK